MDDASLPEEDFDDWGKDFEDSSDEKEGWSSSDDDETSREGSDYSEDSAALKDRSRGDHDVEESVDKDLDRENRGPGLRRAHTNKFTSDPLAYKLMLNKRESKVKCLADGDDSVLIRDQAANCADTDVFKMIVELLLGSPSEIFSTVVEHVIVEGDVTSFLRTLEKKTPLFQTTGLLGDIHFQYLGKESSSQFLTWFIEIASEALLCKKFIDLSEKDISAAPSFSSHPSDSEDAMLSLINSVKTGVCKLVSNFESDVGRLEIEHNSMARASETEKQSTETPFSSASASFKRQHQGSVPFLGRDNSFQLSKSLLSLYSVCEAWQPVLRSCTELVKSLIVVARKHRAAFPVTSKKKGGDWGKESAAEVESLSRLCLLFVEAVDELIRATHMKLVAPEERVMSSAQGDGHGDRLQLRLRELRDSLSPASWFAIVLQEDIFPAAMAYFKSACEVFHSRRGGQQQHSHVSSVSVLTAEDEHLLYPADYAYGDLRGGALTHIHAMYRPEDANGMDMGQTRLLNAMRRLPPRHLSSPGREEVQTHTSSFVHDEWNLSSVYEEDAEEPAVYRELRRRQREVWNKAVEEFERRTGGSVELVTSRQERATMPSASLAESESGPTGVGGEKRVRVYSGTKSDRSCCLPAMSLLQVTVLRSDMEAARSAGLRHMAMLWTRLRLHLRFEALQKVYFMGDESIFRDLKDLVFMTLDVPLPSDTSTSTQDLRVRVRRQRTSPQSTNATRMHLASCIEDNMQALVDALVGGREGREDSTVMLFSVSSSGYDTRAAAGEDGAGEDPLALLRMAAGLSIQMQCTSPLSLVLTEPLCQCYECVLSFLLTLSTCRWVCESVRAISRVSLITTTHKSSSSSSLRTGAGAHTFKKDCHITLGLLLHMLGAIQATLQVQAHQAADYRNFASEGAARGQWLVPWSLDELRAANEYMLREVVRVCAQLQPAVISLTTSAAVFAGKYRSLLEHDADLIGTDAAAFQLHSQSSVALQAQLYDTKQAMRAFLSTLDATVKRGDPKNHACLLQLRDKLRTLFSD